MDHTELKYQEYVVNKCFDIDIDDIELIIADVLSADNTDTIDKLVQHINYKAGNRIIINYFLFMYYSF